MDKKLKKFAAVCLATGLLAFSGATLTGCKPPVGDPTIVDPGNGGNGGNGGGITEPEDQCQHDETCDNGKECDGGITCDGYEPPVIVQKPIEFPASLNIEANALEYEGAGVNVGNWPVYNETTEYASMLGNKGAFLNKLYERLATTRGDGNEQDLRNNINNLLGSYSTLITEISTVTKSPDDAHVVELIHDKLSESNTFINMLTEMHDGNYIGFNNITVEEKNRDALTDLRLQADSTKFNLLFHALRAAKYQEMRQVNDSTFNYSDLDKLENLLTAQGYNAADISSISGLETELNKIIIATAKLDYLASETQTNPQIIADVLNYIIGIEQMYAVVDDIRKDGVNADDIELINGVHNSWAGLPANIGDQRNLKYINGLNPIENYSSIQSSYSQVISK